MNAKFLLVSFILTSCLSVFGSDLNEEKRFQGKTLEFTSQIANQLYCERGKVELILKLSFKNVGNKTIILYKNSYSLQDFVSSLDHKEASIYLQRRSVFLMFPTDYTGKVEFPDPKYFVLLKPNQVFEISGIKVREYRNNDTRYGLKEGNYLLLQSVVTFPFHPKYRGLKDSWAKFGELWMEDIQPAPLNFKIDNSKLSSEKECEEAQEGLGITTRVFEEIIKESN